MKRPYIFFIPGITSEDNQFQLVGEAAKLFYSYANNKFCDQLWRRGLSVAPSGLRSHISQQPACRFFLTTSTYLIYNDL